MKKCRPSKKHFQRHSQNRNPIRIKEKIKNFVLPSDPQTCLHGLLQIHGDEEHVPL